MATPSEEARFEAIEARLSEMEARLGIRGSLTPKKVKSAPSVSPPASAIPPRSADHFESRNWLGITAIACFVLAAIFIVKLSIDVGWLTPARQCGLSACLGFGLIVLGFFLARKDFQYAGYLPAAGIVILYLTVLGAYDYYQLMTLGAALGMACAVSGICTLIYLLLRHDLYALLAAIGAYLAPFATGWNDFHSFLSYYFIFCSIAFAVISVWSNSRCLIMVSAWLSIVTTAFLGLGMEIDHDRLTVVCLACHFLIFSLATAICSLLSGKALTQEEAFGLFPVLFIFYAMEYYFLNRVYPGLAPWISLGFAGILMCIYLFAKERFSTEALPSRNMILGFVTLVVFHSGYLMLIPAVTKPWLFVLALAALILMPSDKKRREAHLQSCWIPLAGIVAVLLIEYVRMVMAMLNDNPDKASLSVSLVSFLMLWGVQYSASKDKGQEVAWGLLGATHILGVLVIYQFTTAYGSLAVSAGWLLYAVITLFAAFSRRDQIMARSAVLVLGFAACKALLYDAASAPVPVRIGCLLLTGGVLYGAGYFLRYLKGWEQTSR